MRNKGSRFLRGWALTRGQACLCVSEPHLRYILRSWVTYYNKARRHSSLGPNVPDPASDLPVDPEPDRHHIPLGRRVVSTPVLGDLHHDYRFDTAARARCSPTPTRRCLSGLLLCSLVQREKSSPRTVHWGGFAES